MRTQLQDDVVGAVLVSIDDNSDASIMVSRDDEYENYIVLQQGDDIVTVREDIIDDLVAALREASCAAH